jgi:hypothetical protein
MTVVGGKVKATLYRAVVPGTPDADRVLFASPVGKVYFDQVLDVSAQVQLAEQDGNIEFSVPLTTLGLTIKPRMTLLGDLGLLRGNGAQTIQRVYWNNLDTAIVSDIPSEARLQPGNWGIFKFTGLIADGSIMLDAATVKLHGTTMRVDGNDVDGFHVGFWSNPQDYVEWTGIAVPAGKYQLDLTYGCGPGAGGKFLLTANGQTLPGTTASTGSWSQYVTVKLGELTFTGGLTSLSIRPDGPLAIGLMDMQSITLTPTK